MPPKGSQRENAMKIAVVSQHFDSVVPPDQNSIGIWSYEIARRLSATDDVFVLLRQTGTEGCEPARHGINLEPLACASPRLWGNRVTRLWSRLRPRAMPLFAHGFYAADYLVQVCRRLRRLRPDVVHVQNFPQHVPAIRRAIPDAAIVLHMHCDWLVQLDFHAMSRAVAGADLVLGCSRYITEAASRRFAGASTVFRALPNGAPPVCSDPTPVAREPGLVLFVGRLTPEKGLHNLMQAWPAVVAAVPAARLEIIGSQGMTPREMIVDLSGDADVRELARFYASEDGRAGGYEDVLKRMLPGEISHTVSFVGHKPYSEVLRRYAAATCLVNPSLSESFGMSLIEAITHGTPVVATRIGGMTEIVEGTGGGVLVDANEIGALSEAIVGMLADPDAAGAMGRHGAQHAGELYSWDHIAGLARKRYAEALSRRRSPEPAGDVLVAPE